MTDGRITIRKQKFEDSVGLYEAVRESIIEISRWADWAHNGYKIEETEKWLKASLKLWDLKREYHFSIVENANGKILGGCGLMQLDARNRIANLGYWVRTGNTGMGVATSAVKLLVKFGFEELELERIELTISPENAVSRRVAEKAGAVYEATLRNRIRFHDRQHDSLIFAIFHPEY